MLFYFEIYVGLFVYVFIISLFGVFYIWLYLVLSVKKLFIIQCPF